MEQGIDLSGLKDIHLPPLPPFFPFPWTAYAVVFGTFLLIALIWFAVRFFRKATAKKTALRKISVLQTESAQNPYAAALEASSLLRRLALMKFPKQKIVPLTGKSWRKFLIQTAGKNAFQGEAGAVLENIQYAPANVFDNIDITPLLNDCADWIRHNF